MRLPLLFDHKNGLLELQRLVLPLVTIAVCTCWTANGLSTTVDTDDLVIDAETLTSHGSKPIPSQSARSLLWHWMGYANEKIPDSGPISDKKSSRFELNKGEWAGRMGEHELFWDLGRSRRWRRADERMCCQ